MALKDVKNRISSVKNIHKITRAMEMVAAARLRRAEQRIEALRPYSQALGEITRQVADGAAARASSSAARSFVSRTWAFPIMLRRPTSSTLFPYTTLATIQVAWET